MDVGLSVEQYEKIRTISGSQGAHWLPGYKSGPAVAKQECIKTEVVKEEALEMSDSGMCLPMKLVHENTLERVLELEEVQKVLTELCSDRSETYTAIFNTKVGPDGFQSRTTYHQLGKDGSIVSDKDTYVSEMVPINLQIITKDCKKVDVWVNLLVNSPLSSRMLRLFIYTSILPCRISFFSIPCSF